MIDKQTTILIYLLFTVYVAVKLILMYASGNTLRGCIRKRITQLRAEQAGYVLSRNLWPLHTYNWEVRQFNVHWVGLKIAILEVFAGLGK